MYYFVKKNIVARNTDDEHNNFYPGDVISDWELNDHTKKKISEGVSWYTQSFEPLTDREAKNFRVKATEMSGKRTAPNGQIVEPPWPDFVGLHPKEVIERMGKLRFDEVEQVRQYERAGMNRESIIDYVAPSEREPFSGYSDMGVRDILEKMSILDDQAVQDIIVYEMHHSKRPAIIEFEPETYETQNDDTELVLPSGSSEDEE